ncbi:MAG: hypothetical protein ACK4QP_06605 [Pseudorhizobium sp.]
MAPKYHLPDRAAPKNGERAALLVWLRQNGAIAAEMLYETCSGRDWQR